MWAIQGRGYGKKHTTGSRVWGSKEEGKRENKRVNPLSSCWRAMLIAGFAGFFFFCSSCMPPSWQARWLPSRKLLTPLVLFPHPPWRVRSEHAVLSLRLRWVHCCRRFYMKSYNDSAGYARARWTHLGLMRTPGDEECGILTGCRSTHIDFSVTDLPNLHDMGRRKKTHTGKRRTIKIHIERIQQVDTFGPCNATYKGLWIGKNIYLYGAWRYNIIGQRKDMNDRKTHKTNNDDDQC